MPSVTDLIADLIAATDQMRQAALGDDWSMAEKIQKRRAVLIEGIVEHAQTVALTEAETLRLSAVREQESVIAARATARHQALGKMLTEAHGITGTERPSRMQKAYGAAGRQT